MSRHFAQIKRIETLTSNELANALQFNGYGECVAPIRVKGINGEQFLKLTEIQISLWRLPLTQSRRLWSFIQQIKLDPNQLLLEPTQNSKKVNHPKQETSLPVKPLRKIANIKTSTLTKEESFHLKSKLEGMFKKEPEETPNTSFVHQQRHPKLPPKPTALQIPRNNEPEDPVEEYLEPITRDFETERDKNNGTFLSKYRRDSGQFNIKIDVAPPQESKTNVFKDRPLPPLPPLPPLKTVTTKVEEDYIEDYAPVIEIEEEIPAYIPLEDDFPSPSRRPLPPLPLPLKNNHEEELPEYVAVVEEEDDDDEEEEEVATKSAVFRRPPPPEPYSVKKSASLTPKPSLSFKVKEDFNSELRLKLKSALKLPKPPFDLPEMPVSVPFLPPKKPSASKSKDFPEARMTVLESSDEDVSIETDEFKDGPWYRETDRKGAKMLLTGLEEGAFVVRPSRQSKFLCTLSIMHTKKMFNIGIEQVDDGMLVLGSTNENVQHPAFYTVNDLVAYYMMYPLQLYGDYITLKNVLPANKR